MSDFYSIAPTLLLATVLAYLLGAIPLAALISRRNGVDIFSVGTGLAGASNVRRHVGNVPGALVLLGDIAKGVSAVVVARYLSVDGMWIILPSSAAIVGHWKPVFTRFRGGDGLATLGGITVAFFTVYGLIAIAIAMLVSLGGQKMPYSSLMGIVMGYLTIVILNVNYYGDMSLTIALGGMAVVVLGYASLGHLKRRRAEVEWGDIELDVDDAEGATEQGRLGP